MTVSDHNHRSLAHRLGPKAAQFVRPLSWADRLILGGIGLLILAIPFGHTKLLQYLGLVMMITGWLGGKWHCRQWEFRLSPLTLPLLGLGLFAVLSLFTSHDPGYTLRRLRGEIMTWLVVVIVIVDSCRRRDTIYAAFSMMALCNVLALLVFLFMWQQSGFDLEQFVDSLWAGHMLSNGTPHTSSYFLFAVIFSYTGLFFIERRQGYYYLVPVFLANLVLLFVTNQRAALIGLGAALLMHVATFKDKRRMVLLVCTAVVVVSAVLIATTSFKQILVHEDWSKIIQMEYDGQSASDSVQLRLGIYRYFGQYLINHPFTGVGYGRRNLAQVKKEQGPLKPVDYTHGHNVFLNLALQTGLQGLSALLIVIVVQFRLVWQGLRRASTALERYLLTAGVLYMVGFWTRLQFDDMLRYETALHYWLVAGLTAAMCLNLRNEDQRAHHAP